MADKTIRIEKAVLTIAVSKHAYIDMACNLAMSFLLWNNPAEISFILATDKPEFIPQKLQQKIKVIKVSEGEIGEGFSSKLNMEQFSQAKQTLFIDADCLVYGNLGPVFDEFQGKDVSVIGYNRTEGKNIGFCHDIAQVIASTGIGYFPLLCGSVYYFEQGEASSKIFAYAKSLLKSYKDIGLTLLRGKENEEPLIAIAMAKFNQQPVNDNGLIKADRMFYEYLQTNVIEGKARLWNEVTIPVPEYSTLKLALPLIVHFNAFYAELYEYQSEVIRLKQVFLNNRSVKTANRYALVFSIIPCNIYKVVKDTLRPVYHAVFGFRKIKALKRM